MCGSKSVSENDEIKSFECGSGEGRGEGHSMRAEFKKNPT